MTTYFVTHPNLDVTAMVHAPSTEKARTTFLDYLERQGKVPRRYRQALRENMVTERLKDPASVTTDVELHYGYEEAPEQTFTLERVFEGQPITHGEPTDVQAYDEALSMGEPIVAEEPKPIERKMSPIARAAMRGFV